MFTFSQAKVHSEHSLLASSKEVEPGGHDCNTTSFFGNISCLPCFQASSFCWLIIMKTLHYEGKLIALAFSTKLLLPSN